MEFSYVSWYDNLLKNMWKWKSFKKSGYEKRAKVVTPMFLLTDYILTLADSVANSGTLVFFYELYSRILSILYIHKHRTA